MAPSNFNHTLLAPQSALAQQLLKDSHNFDLCKTKNNLQVEYALRGLSAPPGIAEFRVLDALPPKLQSSLLTIEQLEAELKGDEERE